MLRLRGLELEQRARVVQPLQQRERGRVRGVLALRVRGVVRGVVRGGAQRGDEVLRVGDRGQRALDIGEQRLEEEKEAEAGRIYSRAKYKSGEGDFGSRRQRTFVS